MTVGWCGCYSDSQKYTLEFLILVLEVAGFKPLPPPLVCCPKDMCDYFSVTCSVFLQCGFLRPSLCSPDCSGTHYFSRLGWELPKHTFTHLPYSDSGGVPAATDRGSPT